MVKEMQDMHCDKIKNFYSELFSGYYRREYYFTQIEFKQRLVEEFKEFGEEICDNNKDDNEKAPKRIDLINMLDAQADNAEQIMMIRINNLP